MRNDLTIVWALIASGDVYLELDVTPADGIYVPCLKPQEARCSVYFVVEQQHDIITLGRCPRMNLHNTMLCRSGYTDEQSLLPDWLAFKGCAHLANVPSAHSNATLTQYVCMEHSVAEEHIAYTTFPTNPSVNSLNIASSPSWKQATVPLCTLVTGQLWDLLD